MNYNPKQLYFDSEARAKLISGITKLSNAVKSTMGPRGNTVLIESPNHTRGMTVTKDGATVAKAVELLDPVENLACRMMRDASDATATSAGDGTSTSIVLTEAIIRQGMRHFADDETLNKVEVLRAISDICAIYIQRLREKSVEVTDELLEAVATVSSNNDAELGKLIADVYKEVGKGGIVHYEKSKTPDTYTEVIKGTKVDRGYSAPVFINDHETDTFTIENCLIFVCDKEIGDFLNQLSVPLLSELLKKNVLFIAPFTNHALQTMAVNVAKNNAKWCVIPPPAMGYRQSELMNDLALSVGAKYFSEQLGSDLSLISIEDLGSAEKVTVSKDRTIIVPKQTEEQEALVNERCKQLEGSLEKATKSGDKSFIRERIAALSGGVGVIYVGGNDMEQKELYDRVEDAVSAVRSAIEEGVLAGAGRSLVEVAHETKSKLYEFSNKEKQAALNIMGEAAIVPAFQILKNAGLDYVEIYKQIPLDMIAYGLNLKTLQVGNLIVMGVVDPLKVTRIALENAVSVATTILSTNAVITMAREIDVK